MLIAVFTIVNANMMDHRDESIDFSQLGFGSISRFYDRYWAACEKFSHIRYKKIMKNRPEPGPFIYAGDHFVRENNIIYDSWNAGIDFLSTWDADTFWKIFATTSAYGLIPYIGGYTRAQAHQEYIRDEHTLINAEVSEDYLFAELMELFKLGYWSFFNLLNSDHTIKY